MVTTAINRRRLLATAGAFGLLPQLAQAEDYIDLEWTDLLPVEDTTMPPMLQGLIDHDQAPLSNQQPAANGVRLHKGTKSTTGFNYV